MAETLAGKKIRCKKCGAVIAVPGGSAAPVAPVRKVQADRLPDEPDLSSLEDDDEAPAPPARPAPRRPNVLPPVSRMPTEVIIEGPDDDDESAPDVEARLAPNRPFAFPGSRTLDAVSAYVVGLVAIVWMVAQTLKSETPGPSYVAHLRWCLYFAAYTFVVYPLTLVGVGAAGKKLRFGMPSAHYAKIFCVFSLPFMLGVILALTGGSLANFITGVVVGLVAALGVFVFLYRLRPEQMGAGIGMTAGFFTAGVVIVTLLGYGINAATLAVMRKQQTVGEYPQSPIGPPFPWDAPPPVEIAKPKRVVVPLAIESGTENPASQPVSTQPATTQTADATSQPVSTQPSPATQPAVAMSPEHPATEPVAVTPAPEKMPASQPAPPAVPVAPASSFVASVIDAPVGEFEDVFFPSLPGVPAVLVVKSRGQTSDAIEIWSTQPFEKKSAISPMHPADEKPAYWLSPKATTYARMVEFPKKAVEIRSTTDDALARTIELDSVKLGVPEIVSFAVNNQIVVLWELNGEFGLEAYDTTTGQRTRTINLPAFQKGKGNLAISPDGRLIAAGVKAIAPVIGRPPVVPPGTIAPPPSPSPVVQVSDVSAGARPPRLYPVTALGSDKSANFAGLNFFPDSTRLSLLYEEAGNSLIVAWKLPEQRPVAQYTLFGTHAPDAAAAYRGPALETLGPTTWLLYGGGVVEADKLLGDLGIPNARGHLVLDRDTIALVVPTEAGKLKLIAVKLSSEKLPKGTGRGK